MSGDWADAVDENAIMADIAAPTTREIRRPTARSPTGQFSVSSDPSARRYSRAQSRPSDSRSNVSAWRRVMADKLYTFLLHWLQWRTRSVPGMLSQSAEQGAAIETRSSLSMETS